MSEILALRQEIESLGDLATIPPEVLDSFQEKIQRLLAHSAASQEQHNLDMEAINREFRTFMN